MGATTGEYPYSLVYGSEAVIPVEIGMPSPQTSIQQEEGDEEARRIDLDLVEEKRDLATIREAKVKERVKRYHDRRVRSERLIPRDKVLRRNDSSRQEKEGKLSPNWEGPYTVVEAHPGGNYVLADAQGRPIPRRWNIANLKKFYPKEAGSSEPV